MGLLEIAGWFIQCSDKEALLHNLELTGKSMAQWKKASKTTKQCWKKKALKRAEKEFKQQPFSVKQLLRTEKITASYFCGFHNCLLSDAEVIKEKTKSWKKEGYTCKVCRWFRCLDKPVETLIYKGSYKGEKNEDAL
jgi:hypothetical protein